MINHIKRERRQITWRKHCYKGHEWTPENTIIVRDRRSETGEKRQCRTCKEIAQSAWQKSKIKAKEKLVDKSPSIYTLAEQNFL